MGSSSFCFLVVCCPHVLLTASSVRIIASFAWLSWISLTRKTGWVMVESYCVHRKPWLGRPDTQALLSLVPHTHSPSGVLVPPAVDWSALIGGFVRWLTGLAPPPPGAGVRSQQPAVPCAPSPPPLHTRAHAQGKIVPDPFFFCAMNQTSCSLKWIKSKHLMPVVLEPSANAVSDLYCQSNVTFVEKNCHKRKSSRWASVMFPWGHIGFRLWMKTNHPKTFTQESKPCHKLLKCNISNWNTLLHSSVVPLLCRFRCTCARTRGYICV